MFGKKKKASGIIAGTSPAQVYRELPVLPRTSQTSIRDEWSRAALEGSSFGEPPVRAGQPVSAEVNLPLHRKIPRYVMEFSDGQRIEVKSRCGAGRMPPTAEDGYEAFAVLHDSSQQTSRRHFEFGVTAIGQVWVTDCDSANGTWLESHGSRIELPKLTRTSMVPGDVLRFGGMRAKLVQVS